MFHFVLMRSLFQYRYLGFCKFALFPIVLEKNTHSNMINNFLPNPLCEIPF